MELITIGGPYCQLWSMAPSLLNVCCRDWYHAHSMATIGLQAVCVQDRDLRSIVNLRSLRVRLPPLTCP